MLLSVKTQLTSDNKFFKYITSKWLSYKSEVLILSLSKIGYKDGRIGGLSCYVDVDVDVDMNVDFEQLKEIVLQIVGTGTSSFSDQFTISKISVDIELRNRWVNWRIFINGGRTWWEYCVASFGYDNDDLVPIRMNVIFFLSVYYQLYEAKT